MSIFRDFFVKEKPVFTGITRGIGGFGFGAGGGGGGAGATFSASGGNQVDGLEPGNGYKYHTFSTSRILISLRDQTFSSFVIGYKKGH